MALMEVVENLATFDEAATIYAAAPWARDSKALIADEPESGGLPEQAKALGMRYFIEVTIARDFLEGWASSLDHAPSVEESCDRLIQYAVNDA
jgi:hypothetical protein